MSISQLPRLLLLVSLATIPAGSGHGQGVRADRNARQQPEASISLIPVGSRSATVWEGEGDSRRPVAVDPNALPPRFFCIREGKEFRRLATSLNRPMQPFRTGSGNLGIYIQATDDPRSEARILTKVAIPPEGVHYDVFLTRANDEEDWANCTSLPIPSSVQDFPKGNVRLVNISGFKTAALVNGKRFDVGAGKHTLAPIEQEKLTIKCAYQDEEKWHLVMDTIIGHESEARITVVIYPTRNPSSPCELSFFHQPDYESILQQQDESRNRGVDHTSDTQGSPSQ